MDKSTLSPTDLHEQAERVRDAYKVFRKQKGGLVGQKLDHEMKIFEAMLDSKGQKEK